MLDTLLERGTAWIVRTRTPITQYTEREIETIGVDPESADVESMVPVVLDIGALSPLGYIRPATRQSGCTMFISEDRTGFVIDHPFEDFVEEYLAWLKRPAVLTESVDG